LIENNVLPLHHAATQSVSSNWGDTISHGYNGTVSGRRLSAHLKHWWMPTVVRGRQHFYHSAYKNTPWRQEFLGCWPAAVEQFTSWVASARCRDRTVQTASKDVSVCARVQCI